jgi:muramoyltetrapeptide carboxypeptidase
MQRRDFFWQTGLASLAALTGSVCHSQPTSNGVPESTQPDTATIAGEPVPVVKPARLFPGATVALIAPGSSLSAERVAKATANLKALGFKVREGKHLRERYGHLAGADKNRLADLHWAFRDPEIDGVWAARGGYGCTRLLPDIDFQLVKKNPKPFIGYSDITALHLAFHQRLGLTCFHGPVAAAEWKGETEHLRAVLMDAKTTYRLALVAKTQLGPKEKTPSPFTIRPGRAAGVLTGGNLSLLAALAGTPNNPIFAGKIVFIEDVEEEPYRIDRMLTQLFQATDLRQAAGIALGVFSDCAAKGSEPQLTLAETLRDRLEPLGIPVAYGFPCGHVNYQATLPYGVQASLDAAAGTLTLKEAAVR